MSRIYDPSGRLSYKNSIKLNGEVGILRFDSEDSCVAVGCNDGTVTVIETTKGAS